jgi:hypothetical protein
VAVLITASMLAPVACSRGSDDPTLQGEVPTTSATTTTTRPTTTTTTGPACPAVDRYTGEAGLAEHRADVDGDQRTDVAQSFPTAGADDRVTLLVDLAAGGGATTEVDSEPGFPAALLGPSVLERDDHQELLWVRVGAGASTVIVGLYWFDDCGLAPVTFPGGEPVELPVGGSVGSVAGAECGSERDPDADLLVREGRLDGDEYEITTTEHRYADGRLTPSPGVEPSVSRTDDPSTAARFRCGDVEL